MPTLSPSFQPLVVALMTLAGICALIVVWRARQRRFAARRELVAVSTAVTRFFQESGDEVATLCMREPNGAGFVALIEPLPSKRFRHSHIVAELLRNHVRKSCDFELAKVYWRFPPRAERETPPPPTEVRAAVSSRFIPPEPGRVRSNQLPKYEVTEAAWESFIELIDGKAVQA